MGNSLMAPHPKHPTSVVVSIPFPWCCSSASSLPTTVRPAYLPANLPAACTEGSRGDGPLFFVQRSNAGAEDKEEVQRGACSLVLLQCSSSTRPPFPVLGLERPN